MRRRALTGLAFACVLSAAAPIQHPRLDVRLVTDEADAVLALLDRRAAGDSIRAADWDALFATEGYRRLQQRERAMQRAFEDSAFQRFVRSPELLARRDSLRAALAAWSEVDPTTAARRAFAYLPDSASIRVRVYPSIKPAPNTFVFEPRTNPAIFFYLDPAISAAAFENTLAHEFHHIGLGSACAPEPQGPDDLDANVRAAVQWMGAFGEGRAVLAAAGGPDVHPHATSSAAERAVWERDFALVAADMRRLETFFLDVAAGRLADEDAQRRRGMSFIATDDVPQGAFYTVGYLMARTVETELGRDRLVASLCDAPGFLADYQRAARRQNEHGARLPLWSDTLLARIRAPVAPDGNG